jgi:hypothetical protein
MQQLPVPLYPTTRTRNSVAAPENVTGRSRRVGTVSATTRDRAGPHEHREQRLLQHTEYSEFGARPVAVIFILNQE